MSISDLTLYEVIDLHNDIHIFYFSLWSKNYIMASNYSPALNKSVATVVTVKPLIQVHQLLTLECFSSYLTIVFAQSIEARC